MTRPTDSADRCEVEGCTGSHVVYVAGHNMPGYLPESDPFAHDTWQGAQADMIGTLDRDADHFDDCARADSDPESAGRFHDDAETLSAHMQDLNLCNGPDWSATVGNVAYWIDCQTLTCEDYAETMSDQS